MKWIRIATAAVLLLGAASAGYAQSGYITDQFEVTLRTGPGIDHKILAMLRSGQPMTVIAEGDEWSQVELPDGRQGYVLNRFIAQGPPARMVLENIRSAHDSLKQRAAELEVENRRLASENQNLQKQLESVRSDLSSMRGEFDTLKTESADFFELKNKYESSASALRQSTDRVNRLEAEVSQLQLNKNIRWFLSGAGVLVLGFLIGFSAKKQRRRSSLL